MHFFFDDRRKDALTGDISNSIICKMKVEIKKVDYFQIVNFKIDKALEDFIDNVVTESVDNFLDDLKIYPLADTLVITNEKER